MIATAGHQLARALIPEINEQSGTRELAGDTYGRVIRLIGGTLGAICASFSIGGANPWRSLAAYCLCVRVVYSIVVLGQDERALRG